MDFKVKRVSIISGILAKTWKLLHILAFKEKLVYSATLIKISLYSSRILYY